MSIKKHSNALAKLRLSDHMLRIQTGRQTRPKKPRELWTCKKCPECVEYEAHFLFQCAEDTDIKSNLAQRIAMDISQFSYLTFKNLKSS